MTTLCKNDYDAIKFQFVAKNRNNSFEKSREIGSFLLLKIRKEGIGWLDGSKNSFFVNKTQRTLEALKILALRVLFMLEKNKQNEEMNKTVLFKIREGGIEKKGRVLFIWG